MKTTKLLSTILLLVAGVFTSNAIVAQDAVFEELDRALESAQEYIDVRETKIAGYNAMLQQETLSPIQRYNIYKSLYEEYYSFQFDKAMEMLDRRYELSSMLGDKRLIADDKLDRAMLYSISAMFLEAGDVIDKEIDTLHLTHEQLVRYYNTQQRFHSDFWHYTSDEDARNRSAAKRTYYRNRILEITDESDPTHRDIVLRNLTESGRWAEAELLNLELLEGYTPDEHEYAMYAYDRARILEALERRSEMREWFARSAISDIRTATKDHASLCSLAQNLLEVDDIERAFRYVTISLNDALYYNAKLRPWQISAIIPEIEKAYQNKQLAHQETLELQEAHSRYLAMIISVLAVLLLAICCYMAYLLRRSLKSSRKIREMNERIEGANAELQKLNDKLERVNSDLREANAVKEEYIALFLSMCSDYIEKLTTMQRSVRRKLSQGKVQELERELQSSSLMDEELDNFYQMFDNAFLNLYPNFVDEFNALLKPDAHIEPKRGERLNTELRIFALIRLGIHDSSRIASLLRYSVNTIYNYRARTKNSALSDRDSFEERIKTIGK